MPSRPSEALPDGSAPPEASAESAVVEPEDPTGEQEPTGEQKSTGRRNPTAEQTPAAERNPSLERELPTEAEPTGTPERTGTQNPAGRQDSATEKDPADTHDPTGTHDPTTEQPAEVAAPTPDHARRVRVLTALGVAAVLLLAAAGLALVGWLSTLNSGPAANEAYVDAAATSEVVGQVTEAITTVYSYDYNALPANEAAARAVITGKFADEFGRVFEPVKQLAPAQQAVLRTTVPAAGVKLLDGVRAQLLMMVDQNGVRGPAKEPTGATARLVVDAQKVDGRWKISEVTPE